VSGTWPADISGDVVFSSPQRNGRLPYALFDFGSICRLSLEPGTRGVGPGRFAWQDRSIETPGKRLYNRHPDVFTPGPTGYSSPFGPPNSSNTAPLPWGNRLFTTWDAGRPVELDPGTLEFVGEVGHVDTWGGSSLPTEDVLPFVFSTAHPVADPDRDCMWTVKLDMVFEPSFALAPSLVRWDRTDGTRVSTWPLEGVVFDGSLHTVSQTRDWVVLADSGNFKADPGEVLGAERTARIDERVPLWLIRKDAVEGLTPGTPVTPVCFTVSPPHGHYYARWEDVDGISIIFEGLDLTDLGMYLRPDDVDVNGNPLDPAAVGLYNMAMAPDTLSELTFDPNSGKVIEQGVVREEWGFNLQLSAMDWSTEGLTHPTLHHLDYQGCRPGNVSRRAAEHYSDRVDLDQLREDTPGSLCSFRRGTLEMTARWEYSDLGDHITSPTFAPRAPAPGSYRGGGEHGGHDGYVVQPVCNDDGFRVELFDAASVGNGPIATLAGTNRETIPFVLHSAWMPVFDELAAAERLRFSDEITPAKVDGLPTELRSAVHEVAEECDLLT
jgi:carotenoid cleavage dioxygenase-like enzyme